MNRRQVLEATTVLATFAAAGSALAQKKAEPAKGKPADAAANPHAGHNMGGPAPAALPATHVALAAAAAVCVEKAEACQAHCIKMLSTGNTSMAACARTVTEMLAVCRGVGMLANMDSKHLKALAAVCISVCTDCEAACKEHAPHHAECKACMEACAETIKAARALG